MFPVYEQKKENVHILQKTSRHAPPHLHNSVEFIYVISGSRCVLGKKVCLEISGLFLLQMPSFHIKK